MSTISTVAYETTDGQVRGTYVHFDGDPKHMLDVLIDRFARVHYQGMIKWIEKGIADNGYSAAEDDQGYQDSGPQVCGINDGDYGYLVRPISKSEYGAPIIEVHRNGRMEGIAICVTD